MSKNRKNDYRDADDYDYDRDYYNDMKERRKVKRMKNSMRSRNIDDLIDLDDEWA